MLSLLTATTSDFLGKAKRKNPSIFLLPGTSTCSGLHPTGLPREATVALAGERPGPGSCNKAVAEQSAGSVFPELFSQPWPPNSVLSQKWHFGPGGQLCHEVGVGREAESGYPG